MNGAADRANVAIIPLLAWTRAFVAGLALDWFYPSRLA